MQGPLLGPVPSPSAIEPWEWVVDTIESSASHIEVVEHWGDQKDLRLVFDSGDSRLAYFATFDFNLLQEWKQIPVENVLVARDSLALGA